MPNSLSRYAFIGGVYSSEFRARADLERYSLGLRDAKNFYVDYRGGAISRPGTQYLDTIPSTAGKLIPFQFNLGEANTYILVVFNQRIWIYQSGARVGAVEISVPYANNELEFLTYQQRRDELFLYHRKHKSLVLRRYSHTDWRLADVFTSSGFASPAAGATGTPGGNASVVYTVTAVSATGEEAPVNHLSETGGLIDYTKEEGYVRFFWSPVPGAVSYNVYRSIVFPDQGASTLGQNLGYIGSTNSARFTDKNITPDFTRSPPFFYNPFTPGQLREVKILNNGSGVADNPTVTVTDPTGGAANIQGIGDDGALTGLLLLNRGRNFTAPVFTVSPGTGVVLQATVAPLVGTYPGAAVFYQSRMWFLGTEELPMTLFSTKLPAGEFFNFHQSSSDGIAGPLELNVASDSLSPFVAGKVFGDELFLFAPDSIWRVVQRDGEYIIGQFSDVGSLSIPPIVSDGSMIYATSDGLGVHAIRPGERGSFQDTDLSVYAGHLFERKPFVRDAAEQRSPDRLIWFVSGEGQLYSLTYVPAQNIYAWMPHDIGGKVLSVASIRVGTRSYLYLLVARTNGLFLEFLAPHDYTVPEDVVALDSCLRLPENEQTTPLVVTNRITSGHGFVLADVGKFIYSGKSKAEIVSVTEGNAELYIWRGPDSFRAKGTWLLQTPQSSASGLNHLEGETVTIFGDGSYLGERVVTGGSIDFPQRLTRATVGLAYEGFIEPLPLIPTDQVVEHRRQNITTATVYLGRSTGAKYAVQSGSPYDISLRYDEISHGPEFFAEGQYPVTGCVGWETSPTVRLFNSPGGVSDYRALALDIEIGDDSN